MVNVYPDSHTVFLQTPPVGGLRRRGATQLGEERLPGSCSEQEDRQRWGSGGLNISQLAADQSPPGFPGCTCSAALSPLDKLRARDSCEDGFNSAFPRPLIVPRGQLRHDSKFAGLASFLISPQIRMALRERSVLPHSSPESPRAPRPCWNQPDTQPQFRGSPRVTGTRSCR